MENRIKKDMYNSSPVDMRTHVKIGEDDEIAVKPYYYFRNGYIHIRYNVDRCIKLSDTEVERIKDALSGTYDKQTLLANEWNFLTTCVKKDIIRDGIAEAEKCIKEYSENGRTY